jgi:hypothetical protein
VGRSRGHRWPPVQRAVVVAVLAMVVGSLYLITFLLALADPVPHRLPQPFLSLWLPTDAAVTAVRNAVYFRAYQHALPSLVLAAWAVAVFAAWLVIMRRGARPYPA